MSVAIFTDVAKTKQVYNVMYFVADGVKTSFMANYPIKSVYIDNIRSLRCVITENIVKFNYPVVKNSTVVLVPYNSIDMYIDGSAPGTVSVPLYVEVSTPVYVTSENIVTKGLGDLLVSLDNINFYSCVEVTTDRTIYVKYVLSEAVDSIQTYANNRLIFVETNTSVNTDGEILVEITHVTDEEGGVEIYEGFI